MNYCVWSKHIAFWSIVGLVFLAMPTTGQAQFEKEPVMTALLYNVARFVTWPEGSFADQDAPLVIALQGDGPLQQEIAGLDGKQIEGRAIAILRLAPTQLPNRNQPCHILYIPQSTSQHLASTLEAVTGQPILTVSDRQDFARKGGILHLEGAHNVSFSLNLDSAEQAGLVLSSKLFRLAKEVIKDGQAREGP
jgi:hypothetical protein